MELRQIRYFLAVASELNFRRAADRVHITQPALSRQISQLEEELGAVLLLRGGRKVELTPAGNELLLQATRILSDLERARLAVQRASSGERGLLVVGYIPSAAFSAAPQVLRYVRRLFPDVEVDLRSMLTQHQYDALVSRKIDIGLLRPWRRIKGLASRPVISEAFVVAVPERHSLAGKKNVPLSRFAEDEFIMHARQIPGISLTYDVILRMFVEAGIAPKVALESPEDVHMTLGMVQAGFGVAVVPRSMMLSGPRGVAFTELRDHGARSEVVIAWREDEEDRRIAQLAELSADKLEKDLWKPRAAAR